MKYCTQSLFLVLILIGLLTGTLWSQEVDSESAIVRADLELPQNLWDQACKNVGYMDRPIGYSPAEMANFPDHPYRLRRIDNLFDDVRKIPRYSGLVSDNLLKNAHDPSKIVASCYQMLDAYAGRGLEMPEGDNWGTDLIPDGTSPDKAFDYVLFNSDEYRDKYEQCMDLLLKLPVELQRFIIRIIIAHDESSRILDNAFDKEIFSLVLECANVNPDVTDLLYEKLIAPWKDSDEIVESESFKALDQVDLNYLAYASVVYFSHVQNAINEFHPWIESNKNVLLPDYEPFRFKTIVGDVLILDKHRKASKYSSIYPDDASIIIDLGDSYIYQCKPAEIYAFSPDNPVRTLIDFGGDDHYITEEWTLPSLGCGFLGINAIFDLSGNDTYECSESGIGSGLYGTGLVIDYQGNDKYLTKGSFGQGAAHVGVGALIDLAGDDEYIYGDQSQGLGSTLGIGLLIDKSGNDKYLHTEKIRKIALETPRNKEPGASLSQGCGFGRRADFSDGHSLAGGIGILIDGDGNDEYEGRGRFAQGTGYWWGLGIFEDYGGNDKYIGYWYAQGASAHFGIGSFVDLQGDDIYNDEYAKSQFLGNGRDGSIAVFIDGSGDDFYAVTNRSAGEGDLNGIGLFWDRSGDDYYKIQTCEVFKKTPVLGAATTQSGMERTFRAILPSIGIFFDTGGIDTYDDAMYVDQHITDRKLQAFNNSEWFHNEGPVLWGYGTDVSEE